MSEDEGIIAYPFFIRIGLKPEMKSSKIGNLLGRKNDMKREFLIEQIKQLPGVSNVWFTDHERFDLLVEVKISSAKEGAIMISKLKNLDGVAEAEEDINTLKMY